MAKLRQQSAMKEKEEETPKRRNRAKHTASKPVSAPRRQGRPWRRRLRETRSERMMQHGMEGIPAVHDITQTSEMALLNKTFRGETTDFQSPRVMGTAAKKTL
ncbi:unnamed protein product [Urochloa humidicola]